MVDGILQPNVRLGNGLRLNTRNELDPRILRQFWRMWYHNERIRLDKERATGKGSHGSSQEFSPSLPPHVQYREPSVWSKQDQMIAQIEIEERRRVFGEADPSEHEQRIAEAEVISREKRLALIEMKERLLKLAEVRLKKRQRLMAAHDSREHIQTFDKIREQERNLSLREEILHWKHRSLELRQQLLEQQNAKLRLKNQQLIKYQSIVQQQGLAKIEQPRADLESRTGILKLSDSPPATSEPDPWTMESVDRYFAEGLQDLTTSVEELRSGNPSTTKAHHSASSSGTNSKAPTTTSSRPGSNQIYELKDANSFPATFAENKGAIFDVESLELNNEHQSIKEEQQAIDRMLDLDSFITTLEGRPTVSGLTNEISAEEPSVATPTELETLNDIEPGEGPYDRTTTLEEVQSAAKRD